MKLNVYDMDGTIVDSTKALRECQLDGLERAMKAIITDPVPNILKREDYAFLIDKHGLKGALQQLNVDQDEFFKVHYHTFDPVIAAKEGRMSVFDDATDTFYRTMRIPFNLDALISNSTKPATMKKLSAVGLENTFQYVLAEVEKAKAKPTPYMANQLVDSLREDNHLDSIRSLMNVGDMPVDMEFGFVMHDVLSTAAGRNIPFRNYLVNRTGAVYDSLHKDVQQISAMTDIYNGE